MNWEQLKTVLWLRWRLTRNQMARKRTDAVLAWIGFGLGALLAVGSGLGGFLGGQLGLAQAKPEVHLLLWDIVLGFFFLLWVISILAEIQRSESIDLARLLHLPVSLPQIFLINYLASLFNFTLLIFLPGMIGLSAGLVLAVGFSWLFLVPVIAGFVFAVTAWTYCLRGWLVSLMTNQRRRRAIVVGLTMGFIVLAQIPNLYFNLTRKPRSPTKTERPGPPAEHTAHPPRPLKLERLEAAHRWVPPLWLPYAAMQLAEKRISPALWGTAGFLLLGGLGLQRAYQGTLRFYLGTQHRRRSPKKAMAPPEQRPRKILLERRLPLLSESATVLTLAFVRSTLRAPESKMVFAMPFVMTIIFGSMLFSRDRPVPEMAQSVIPTGMVFFILISLIQVFSNHFGFDRGGFRALVLSPVPRWHILLGKNLALLTFAFCLALIFLCILALVMSISWGDLLTGFVQFLSGFLCFAMVGNLSSILFPWRIAPGSLKPTKMGARAHLSIMAFHLLFPVVLLPLALPILLQALSVHLGWMPGIPVHVIGSLLIFAVVLLMYCFSLQWLGHLLQRREQKILQAVTQEVE